MLRSNTLEASPPVSGDAAFWVGPPLRPALTGAGVAVGAAFGSFSSVNGMRWKELTPGGRQFAPCRIQKNHRNHHADSEGDQERTKQSILAKPIHWNFTGRRRVSWSS